MTELLWFLVGLLLGGCVATVVLCCVNIDRIDRYERQIRDLRIQLCKKE